MNEEFGFNETNVNDVVEVAENCELVEAKGLSIGKKIGIGFGIGAAAIGIGAFIYKKCKSKIESNVIKSLEKKGYTVIEPIGVDNVELECEHVEKD